MLPFDLWESPAIRKRLLQEAMFDQNAVPAKDQYWIYVSQPDKTGQVVLRNFNPGPLDPPPHEMQIAFAEAIRATLQKEYGHDGFWMVGFTHPPASWESIRTDGDNCWNRFLMIWADKDGDIKFPFETEDRFVEMLENGDLYYVGVAERCWQAYDEAYGKKALKEDFGISPEQMTKPTLTALAKT